MRVFGYVDVIGGPPVSVVGSGWFLRRLLRKRFGARQRGVRPDDYLNRGFAVESEVGKSLVYEVWPGLRSHAATLWVNDRNEILRLNGDGARADGRWARFEVDQERVQSELGVLVHEEVIGDLSSVVFFHYPVPLMCGEKVMIVGRGLAQLFSYCGMLPALELSLIQFQSRHRISDDCSWDTFRKAGVA